jgi:hypothetical protein
LLVSQIEPVQVCELFEGGRVEFTGELISAEVQSAQVALGTQRVRVDTRELIEAEQQLLQTDQVLEHAALHLAPQLIVPQIELDKLSEVCAKVCACTVLI